MGKNKIKAILLNVIAILISGVFLFPLYWLIVTSLKFEVDIFKSPPSLFPERLYFASYIEQFKSNEYSIIKGFGNSIIISSSTMIFVTLLAIPAAYGLARFRFKGKKIITLSFLVTQMLPATMLLTPLFIIFKKLNILNNFISPVLADATMGIPFSILILRTYFLSIPKELEDYAKIDGCGHFTAFTRIMIPVSFPGVIVACVFSFLFAWGDLAYSLTFINEQQMRPITAGIYNFLGYHGTSWNNLMAFGFVSIFPVVLIFIFMQKYIISGLTGGSVKG